MRHEDAQEALIALRYSGVPLAAEVQEHLASCDLCRQEAAADLALDGILALESSEPPRPGFDTRFYARLKDAQRGAQPRRFLQVQRDLWRWWAVAASFAVAMGFFAIRATRVPGMRSEDVELAMDLELMDQDLTFLRKLDDVEAYEVLSRLDAKDELR